MQLEGLVKEPSDNISHLEVLIWEIASTGNSSFVWAAIKVLLSAALEKVMASYLSSQPTPPDVDGESYEVRNARVKDFLSAFSVPPFTLQRMAELLAEPRRYYSNGAKFFVAFSKLVCGIKTPMLECSDDDEVMSDDDFPILGNGMFSFTEQEDLNTTDHKAPPPLPGNVPPPLPEGYGEANKMNCSEESSGAEKQVQFHQVGTLDMSVGSPDQPPLKQRRMV